MKMKKKNVRKIRDLAVCGQCMELIDLNNLLPKIWNGERVVHDCGRVLNEGKEQERSARDRQTAQDWGEVKDREWGRGV